jgi:hypothetical protein
MPSPQISALNPRIASFIACAVVLAAIALVLAPGVAGDWGRDDYFQLAFARMLDSPWPLFADDHFPVPGSVFRPLGFASMWLGVHAFGIDYAVHAWSDVALHAAAALALLSLLRRIGVATLPALLATLFFALHPATGGTALWWSARFDLLATTFVLVALNAAFAYRASTRAGTLLVALAAALAATLSKEIGLVAIAAMVLAWAHWAIIEPARRRHALCAIASALLCACVYFAWRTAVLGTPASSLTGALPLGATIAKGLADWLHQATGYFSYWARLGLAARVLLVAAPLAIVLSTWRQRIAWRNDLAPLLCGACLLVLPALLQAPVAALNAQPLGNVESAVEAAMQSRLYYLGIAGGALILAVMLDRARRSGAGVRWPALAAFVVFALVALGAESNEDAREFARRSSSNARMAHAAVAAVDALALPDAPCHIVFLGIEPPPEWGTFVSMDSVVKALDADASRVARCWFHANYPTWFFLLPTPVAVADAAPYPPLQLDGGEVPWLRVGTATFAYLQAPATVDADARARMRFLRWNGMRFDDVGADVAAGRLLAELRVP